MSEKPIPDSVVKDFSEAVKEYNKSAQQFREAAIQMRGGTKEERTVNALEGINSKLWWVCYGLFALVFVVQFYGCHIASSVERLK